MRPYSIAFTLLLPVISLSAQNVPVIVELFTSEGCSSCPPADEVLARVEGSHSGADVIALGEHVTYWDRLGWKDRFSQNIFTERQEAYGERFRLGSVYTPQVVVNGSVEALGSDENRVRGAIAKAAKDAGVPVDVKLQAGDLLTYKIANVPRGAEVILAVTESHLDTSVKSGENGGRNLRHTGVVRSVTSLGTASLGQSHVAVDKTWKRENLKFVVFVQEKATRKILGAGSAN
jgi:hypothetical protein